MWLFLAFLLVPLIEIALFIQIGGLIGLWPTLAIVVITAVAGTYLVRSQGGQVLADLRRSFDRLNDPTEPLAHGAMILFSGALLLTPGFFTDAVGFALLIPGIRRAVISAVRARATVQTVQFGTRTGRAGGTTPEDIIETEYHEVTPEKSDGNSGWTRH